MIFLPIVKERALSRNRERKETGLSLHSERLDKDLVTGEEIRSLFDGAEF